MGRVKAGIRLPGITSEAEQLWYETRRWPTFVDGCAHVEKVTGQWPAQRGARVVWDSPPNGRGRVVEQVVAYEARLGQTVHVEDERMRGTQRVEFAAVDGGGVEMTLTLEYDIKQERGVRPIVDYVFVKRPMRESLKRTLRRFARELQADREGIF